MGEYRLEREQVDRMCKNFDRLRFKVRELGLLNGSTSFFVRKFAEACAIIGLSLFLQYRQYYVCSALLMGLAWQQLGWMIHEYCHHQHFKVFVFELLWDEMSIIQEIFFSETNILIDVLKLPP